MGEAAYATVQGIQSQGVIATSKHYIAYEQESYRMLYAADDPYTLLDYNNTQNTYDSILDDRTLHELYLKPFMNAVRAGTGSVMCSYQQINGTPACESHPAMSRILKSELNFQGFIVSDWSAVFNASNAVTAGVDVTMPGGQTTGGFHNLVTGQAFIDAVNNGEIAMSRVDDAVTRFLAQYFLRSQDQGYPETNFYSGYQRTYLNDTLVNEHANVQTDDSRQVSRDINEEAITLVYNHNNPYESGPSGFVRSRGAQGVGLPLKKSNRVAVFGSDAGPSPFGINGCQEWIGPGSNLCPSNRTSNGTNALGWGSGAGYFPYIIDPLAGISEAVRNSGQGALESNLNDWNVTGENLDLIQQFASEADASLVFVQARSGEDSDRTTLELEANGDELIAAVSAASNNTIVIAHTTAQVYVDAWFKHKNVTALVMPHLPGQESGNTLAKMLWGEVNPSGKMPYSILSRNDSDQYPQILKQYADDGTLKVPFDEGLFIDYRQWDAKNITPLVHFGHGASYTFFQHSQSLQAHATGDHSAYPAGVDVSGDASKTPGGHNALWQYLVTLQTSVKNVGAHCGKEVSQLYIGFPSSVPNTPVRQLVGFQKVYLTQGESKDVQFQVTRRDMSYWSVEEQKFVLPDGRFTFWSGSSSREADLKGKVTVEVKNGQVVE